jgi:hypothetical protein
MFVFLLSACGKTYPNDTDFTTRIRDESLEISDYTGKELDIVIPDAIDGISVTSIASQNFMNKYNSVVIPESVKNVGKKGSGPLAFLIHLFVKDKLVRISIGANVRIEKNGAKGGFGHFNEFRQDYDKNGKKSGVYIYEPGNAVKNTILGGTWRIE